jgi:hypothetical protein
MKEPHIIDWILDCTSQTRNHLIKHGQRKNWKKEFNVFHCQKCNKAYEVIQTGCTDNKRTVLRYQDFPKYKLRDKVCLDCKPRIVK